MVTRLLYLDTTGVLAFGPRPGGLAPEGEFAADESGIKRFELYLRAHHRSVFRLITDFAEETYLGATLPQARGADRSRLIQRKLAQSLPGTPYAAALPLGLRTASGSRKEEALLYLGIHRPELLDPWIKVITDSGTALHSAHTLAQCGSLLASLPRTLLTLHTRAGLRQIFIDDNTLRFSRLTPLPAGMAADWQVVLIEADKTRQYLIRERLLGGVEKLPVIRITRDTTAPSLAIPGLAPRIEHPDTIAARLKLRHPSADWPIESLALWALERRPPRQQLAPTAARVHHLVRQARLGIHAATIAIALCFAGSATALWLETQSLTTGGQLPILNQTPPPREHGYTLAELKTLTRGFHHLQQRSLGPEPLLQHLSTALDGHTGIDIDRIDWIASSLTAGTSTTAVFGEQATVIGHATAPAQDARAQIEAISQFVRTLESKPGWQVQLQKLPIDLDPTKTLRGTDIESPATPGQFALTLSRSL